MSFSIPAADLDFTSVLKTNSVITETFEGNALILNNDTDEIIFLDYMISLLVCR